MKQKVDTSAAPAAIGPYSQAVKSNGQIYVSGQLPIDPKTGDMPQGVKAQTKQSLENIAAILASEGLGMDSVVKTTVLLQDIADFNPMNEVYAQYFSGVYPARAAFQVAALPKGALVEVEVVACEN
mgnify:CR=1 FL=1